MMLQKYELIHNLNSLRLGRYLPNDPKLLSDVSTIRSNDTTEFKSAVPASAT